MSFLNKLEKKLGRLAIRNLATYIIATYIVGYVIYFFMPAIFGSLSLEPALILNGEVWRLITWIMIPPSDPDVFTIIMLMLYYYLGNALEETWGAFRFTAYIFTGLIATVIGAFILHFAGYTGIGGAFSTYYINISIFLAFAVSYPNRELILFFIIPIKVKWLGVMYGILIFYEAMQSTGGGRVAIIASLFNFILFFLITRDYKRISASEIKRKQTYHRTVRQVQPRGVTKHKCAICGRTEEDSYDIEFRFCSKCDGNYEYCQEHLFTHEHVHRH